MGIRRRQIPWEIRHQTLKNCRYDDTSSGSYARHMYGSAQRYLLPCSHCSTGACHPAPHSAICRATSYLSVWSNSRATLFTKVSSTASSCSQRPRHFFVARSHHPLSTPCTIGHPPNLFGDLMRPTLSLHVFAVSSITLLACPSILLRRHPR